MTKFELTVGHMVTGHLFGLAPLWEGEISVYVPAISDSGQQESVQNGEPKGEALVCSTWCGSGWGPCLVVTAKMLAPGETALLTEWAWVTFVPAQPR